MWTDVYKVIIKLFQFLDVCTHFYIETLTNGGDGVTDSALRDLELRNRGPSAQTSKSTLIIHSVQRVGLRSFFKYPFNTLILKVPLAIK